MAVLIRKYLPAHVMDFGAHDGDLELHSWGFAFPDEKRVWVVFNTELLRRPELAQKFVPFSAPDLP